MHQFLFIAIPAGIVALIIGLTKYAPTTAKAMGGFILVSMAVSSLFAGLAAVLR